MNNQENYVIQTDSMAEYHRIYQILAVMEERQLIKGEASCGGITGACSWGHRVGHVRTIELKLQEEVEHGDSTILRIEEKTFYVYRCFIAAEMQVIKDVGGVLKSSRKKEEMLICLE